MLTWLIRHSGMADGELHLITGNFRRTSPAIHQHAVLDGQLANRTSTTYWTVG